MPKRPTVELSESKRCLEAFAVHSYRTQSAGDANKTKRAGLCDSYIAGRP